VEYGLQGGRSVNEAAAIPLVRKTMNICVMRREWVVVSKSAFAVDTPEAVDGR
jgi:hypothetical protein